MVFQTIRRIFHAVIATEGETHIIYRKAALIRPQCFRSAEVKKEGYRRNFAAYVIRNSFLTPEWSDVERQTLSIAGKAISTLINFNGLNDLYGMYLVALRVGAEFNLAYVGQDFHAPHPVDFDREYMRALYRFGYEKAARGYDGEKAPPGFKSAERLTAEPGRQNGDLDRPSEGNRTTQSRQ